MKVNPKRRYLRAKWNVRWQGILVWNPLCGIIKQMCYTIHIGYIEMMIHHACGTPFN